MPSDIDRAIAGFDRALRARERAAIERMVRAYAESWRRVSREAAALRRRAQAEGNAEGLLVRAEWKEAFARRIAAEIAQFGDGALGEVLALQSAAVQQAVADARTLVGLSAGDDAVIAMMRRPSPAAVQAMVGAASNGSPLRDLLSVLTQGTPERMAETLAAGIAQGLNANVVAGQLRRLFGVPAARAVLIARTETHRAYNAATMVSYRANSDILDGWVWMSACDRRSCGACFAMHGSIHRMNETLDGHPGCRCKALPLVKGMRPPPIVAGKQRFEELPEAIQRRILGPGKWDAWERGQVRLEPRGPGSIVGRRRSRRWGTMRTERSLRAILDDFATE